MEAGAQLDAAAGSQKSLAAETAPVNRLRGGFVCPNVWRTSWNEGFAGSQQLQAKDDRVYPGLVAATRSTRSAIRNFGPDPGRDNGSERGVEKFDPTRALLQVPSTHIGGFANATRAIASASPHDPVADSHHWKE